MHKFIVSKSCRNCTRVVYTPNFKSLILKDYSINHFINHLKFHICGDMISKKEIWLYFFNLLRKWKLTMKGNISNANVFCTFKCIRRVLIEMTNNATRWWKLEWLPSNNNNYFWQPQKVLWKNVFCETYLYVSKDTNMHTSKFKGDLSYIYLCNLFILQIHLCQRAMTCDELAALSSKGNFTASIRNKRNNSAWALAGNVDNPEEMWCRQNSSSMRKVKSAENLSNPRIIVNR